MCAPTPMLTKPSVSVVGPLVGRVQFGFEHRLPALFASSLRTLSWKSSRTVKQAYLMAFDFQGVKGLEFQRGMWENRQRWKWRSVLQVRDGKIFDNLKKARGTRRQARGLKRPTPRPTRLRPSCYGGQEVQRPKSAGDALSRLVKPSQTQSR
jgi:hypothetical protein